MVEKPSTDEHQCTKRLVWLEASSDEFEKTFFSEVSVNLSYFITFLQSITHIILGQKSTG
jgi:hypothetical protein